MRSCKLTARCAAVTAVVLASLPVLAVSVQPGARTGEMVPAAHATAVRHLATWARAATPGQVLFQCQVPTFGLPCYGPSQIRAAYGVQRLLDRGVTGQGRTIVVVDAFQDPFLLDDVHLFDSSFGLPDPRLRVLAPQGLTTFDITDPNQIGWSSEIALDVEWAHAIAPGAAIDLVLARTDADSDIFGALRYAVDRDLGAVISQSFGEGERCMDPALMRAEHELFGKATRQGITLFASTGDTGQAQGCTGGTGLFASASTPASDPYVTAVGGTALTADLDTGRYRSETAWNEVVQGEGQFATGGGFSTVYRRPEYQEDVPGIQRGRGVPDVAFNAGVSGGFLVHWGVGAKLAGDDPKDPGVKFVLGGTSFGPPAWAGITALADQQAGRRLGFLNPELYQIGLDRDDRPGTLHDTMSGNNGWDGFPATAAVRGWDAATGWGSPRASRLVNSLARRPDGDGDGSDSEAEGATAVPEPD